MKQKIYREYYTVARRYEFRVASSSGKNNISRVSAANE